MPRGTLLPEAVREVAGMTFSHPERNGRCVARCEALKTFIRGSNRGGAVLFVDTVDAVPDRWARPAGEQSR